MRISNSLIVSSFTDFLTNVIISKFGWKHNETELRGKTLHVLNKAPHERRFINCYFNIYIIYVLFQTINHMYMHMIKFLLLIVLNKR